MKRKTSVFGLLAVLPAAVFFVLQAFFASHAAAGTKETVYLYFADPQTGYLTGEARQMEGRKDEVSFLMEIVKGLISGPENNLSPVLPPGAELLALYSTPEGTVFVDLSGDVADGHPGGVRTELLSVYSIVNTIVFNSEGIGSVRILVDGSEAETLAGHVDISRPLEARMLLVR